MKKLLMTFKCAPMSVFYQEGTVSWHNPDSSFTIQQEGSQSVGYFSVWREGVEPYLIRALMTDLKELSESLTLAVQIMGNIDASSQVESVTYFLDNISYDIKTDSDIEGIIRRARGEVYTYGGGTLPLPTLIGTGHTDPVPIPIKMPYIPLSLKR